jgi:hypothetical protein
VKSCPTCNAPLVTLSSQRLKLCVDCKAEYPWPLKEGQKPIVTNNRDKTTCHP